MKYKVLYTNGDSWTWGDEIDGFGINNNVIRYYNTWPWLLSQELDIGVCVNESEPGKSNYRIFRRTLKFIFEWIDKGKDPNDLMIVIGWTTNERFEFPVKDINNNPSYVGLLIQYPNYYQIQLNEDTKKKINEFHKFFYELLDTENQSIEIARVNQLRILRIICRYYGIKYFDFVAIGENLDWVKTKYKNEFDDLVSGTFQDHCIKNKWELYSRQHPTIKAHNLWCKHLKNFIYEHNF